MYLLYVLCIILFLKKQQTNFVLLNTVSSEDVFLLCHEGCSVRISVRRYSRFQALHWPIMAPNKPSTMAELWWEAGSMQGHTWSWAKLGQLLSTSQCPPHSGTGQLWFSSQPHGKVLNGGVGNATAPSSTSGPASGEACGKVALWLLCARRRIRCSWDKGTRMVRAWLITILEKHNSEMCKALQSSVISFMLTENRFLADFFFFLSSSDFFFEDEKEES